jgi:hypothetical protein
MLEKLKKQCRFGMINPPQSVLELRKKYKDLTNKEKQSYTKKHEDRKHKNKQIDVEVQKQWD